MSKPSEQQHLMRPDSLSSNWKRNVFEPNKYLFLEVLPFEELLKHAINTCLDYIHKHRGCECRHGGCATFFSLNALHACICVRTWWIVAQLNAPLGTATGPGGNPFSILWICMPWHGFQSSSHSLRALSVITTSFLEVMQKEQFY